MSRNQSADISDHLMGLVNTTAEAFITINELSEVVFWNSSAEKLFQYSSDEIIGKKLHQIIPNRFHSMHDTGVDRVSKGGPKHVIGRPVKLEGKKRMGRNSQWN